MKNGKNTDLNNQNVEFGGPLKIQKRDKNEFTHMETTNFYVQGYRDTALNTKLGKVKT